MQLEKAIFQRTRNLLNQGANQTKKEITEKPPLSTAGFHGETEIVVLLKRGADISRLLMMETPPYTLLPSFVVQTSLKSTCKRAPQ